MQEINGQNEVGLQAQFYNKLFDIIYYKNNTMIPDNLK